MSDGNHVPQFFLAQEFWFLSEVVFCGGCEVGIGYRIDMGLYRGVSEAYKVRLVWGYIVVIS